MCIRDRYSWLCNTLSIVITKALWFSLPILCNLTWFSLLQHMHTVIDHCLWLQFLSEASTALNYTHLVFQCLWAVWCHHGCFHFTSTFSNSYNMIYYFSLLYYFLAANYYWHTMHHNLCINVVKQKHRLISVSYTHLDVYKRQHLWCGI